MLDVQCVMLGTQPQALDPTPPAPQAFPCAGQVSGHETVVPQLFLTEPQATPLQVVLFGVQPQALGPAPPPPHVLGDVQVLVHCTVWPQLLTAVPHALFLQASALSGMHVHVEGEPTQV